METCLCGHRKWIFQLESFKMVYVPATCLTVKLFLPPLFCKLFRSLGSPHTLQLPSQCRSLPNIVVLGTSLIANTCTVPLSPKCLSRVQINASLKKGIYLIKLLMDTYPLFPLSASIVISYTLTHVSLQGCRTNLHAQQGFFPVSQRSVWTDRMQ